jgi:hypothetical protein
MDTRLTWNLFTWIGISTSGCFFFFVKMLMTLRFHTIQKIWVVGRIPAFKGAISAM